MRRLENRRIKSSFLLRRTNFEWALIFSYSRHSERDEEKDRSHTPASLFFFIPSSSVSLSLFSHLIREQSKSLAPKSLLKLETNFKQSDYTTKKRRECNCGRWLPLCAISSTRNEIWLRFYFLSPAFSSAVKFRLALLAVFVWRVWPRKRRRFRIGQVYVPVSINPLASLASLGLRCKDPLTLIALIRPLTFSLSCFGQNKWQEVSVPLIIFIPLYEGTKLKKYTKSCKVLKMVENCSSKTFTFNRWTKIIQTPYVLYIYMSERVDTLHFPASQRSLEFIPIPPSTFSDDQGEMNARIKRRGCIFVSTSRSMTGEGSRIARVRPKYSRAWKISERLALFFAVDKPLPVFPFTLKK